MQQKYIHEVEIAAFFQFFDLARGLGINTLDTVFTPEGSNGL